MLPAYLVLALSVAGLGAFTDIRSGRVKNKHLMISLTVWLLLVVSECFILHSSSVPVFPLALNVLLAVIVSVILYLADIWAPGDCKLFIVISLVFPMRAYVVREGNIFPALDFVIYAFTLGYIFLIAETFTRKSALNIGNVFSVKRALSVLANTGIISLLNVVLEKYAPKFFYANQILCILCSAALIFLFQKKADTPRKIIGFIGLVCVLLQSILLGSWLNICLNLAASLVIASAIEFISTRVRVNTYREISGDDVRPGMILSFVSLLAMQRCIDPELPKTTTENRRSRLSQRQANAVKTWCRNARSNVVIVEMMPFAPFIAGAVAIEILRFLLLR